MNSKTTKKDCGKKRTNACMEKCSGSAKKSGSTTPKDCSSCNKKSGKADM